MEIARYALLATALKGENRRRAVFPEGFYQLKLVGFWNRMTEDEQVETSGPALRQGLGKAKSRRDAVTPLFQQHAASREQTHVIRDREYAFTHNGLIVR